MSESPAPLAELARYCIEHPKMAGYINRAWIEESGRRFPAHMIASYELSLDAVCEKQRRGVEIFAEESDRLWWRMLPSVLEVSGWTDEDTFGDGAGNYIAIKFERPYYIARARAAVDPDMRGELLPILVKPEGGYVPGHPTIEDLRTLCGVEKQWAFTDAERPEFFREWHTPFPDNVEFFRGDDR
jgi:hypothetical protein